MLSGRKVFVVAISVALLGSVAGAFALFEADSPSPASPASPVSELEFPSDAPVAGTDLPERQHAGRLLDFNRVDYEGSDDGDGDNERLEWTRDPAGSDNTVLQVSLESGDEADLYGGHRTELWRTPRDNCNGCEGWQAFGFYLPRDFEYATEHWGPVLMQNHGKSGNPPQALELFDSDADRDDERNEINFWTQTGPESEATNHRLGHAARGVWHYVLVHIHFSVDDDGFVEVWHSEDALPDPSDPPAFSERDIDTLYDGHPNGGMAKLGMYGDGDRHSRTVYYCGYHRAATAQAALDLPSCPAASGAQSSE